MHSRQLRRLQGGEGLTPLHPHHVHGSEDTALKTKEFGSDDLTTALRQRT